MHKKCVIITIGCRLNQADAALISYRLKKAGYELKNQKYGGHVDLVIINSCVVTHNAFSKTGNAIRKYRKKYPDALIVLTGCGTNTEQEYWLKQNIIDIIIPNELKPQISEFIENKNRSVRDISHSSENPVGNPVEENTFKENAFGYFPFKSRAFVKIQEGCEEFCSYCIVPYTRGHVRSREPEEIIAEVKYLLEQGFKEIVLTGTNICAYKTKKYDLPALISGLADIRGNFRLRLSSTEPDSSNFRLIDIMAENPKICKFLHLPLQHGTDEILKLMNRKYTINEFKELIAYARNKIKNIHIGSDIIVGFPGETDELFQCSCQYIKHLGFANLHIFTYSKRKGTPAASFPDQVPATIKKERYSYLSAIAEELKQQYITSFINTSVECLIEKVNSDGSAEGWTDNYIRVKIMPANNLKIPIKVNEFITVTPTKKQNNNILIAEI